MAVADCKKCRIDPLSLSSLGQGNQQGYGETKHFAATTPPWIENDAEQ
jgi:hypothetical protein